MMASEKTRHESETSRGKWILRHIVERSTNLEWEEFRRWELIDRITGIVRRYYEGYELWDPGVGPRAVSDCLDGHLSVGFSDDRAWLDVVEVRAGTAGSFSYKERLPDTGSDEERALAELLLAPEVPSDQESILRLVDMLGGADSSYPPGSRCSVHERAIKRLKQIGSGAIPPLLAAMENEACSSGSVAIALRIVGGATKLTTANEKEGQTQSRTKLWWQFWK
jgi:hypothetical protein